MTRSDSLFLQVVLFTVLPSITRTPLYGNESSLPQQPLTAERWIRYGEKSLPNNETENTGRRVHVT